MESMGEHARRDEVRLPCSHSNRRRAAEGNKMICQRCLDHDAEFLVTSEIIHLPVCFLCALFAIRLSWRVPPHAPGLMKIELLKDNA
jgi:hypothetical protein